jgi:hypothetical protein
VWLSAPVVIGEGCRSLDLDGVAGILLLDRATLHCGRATPDWGEVAGRAARVFVGIRADRTGRGRVSRTKDISSAGSHAGAVFGALPAPAEIVAGGRSTDVRSVLRNGAVIDPWRRSRHPLPWWNTPSGGENHVRDADGRSVYNGADAAEMFRLYTCAVQAEAEVVARGVADHPRRRGRRSFRAWPAGLASRVRGLRHFR